MKVAAKEGERKVGFKVLGVAEAEQAAALGVKSGITGHDHIAADKHLKMLTKQILQEYGQEKLDELYEQVDTFKTKLAGNGFSASNFNSQFGLCAENEKEAIDKDLAMLVFLCFSEETFDTIVELFYDHPSYGHMLKDYSEAINYACDSLGDEGKILIGQLYPEYLTDTLEE